MTTVGFPNFDTNTWYQITESRVDFNSSLQLLSSDLTGLFMGAACTDCLQKWQIIPTSYLTGSAPNGSFVFRNEAAGTSRQLGVCYAPKELDSSKTKPCMLDAGENFLSGPFTKWDITTWKADGSLRITNVGNGTSYNLDCHRGDPMFLSSDTAPQPVQPAQHWLFSSIGVINDQTFSTGVPGPRSTSTSSSSPTSSSTSSSSQSSSPSPGLSPGAAAGIGVGVGLVVLIAILLGLFFFCRHRKRNRIFSRDLDAPTDPPVMAEADPETSTVASGDNYPTEYGQIDHKYRFEVADFQRYELSGASPPVKTTKMATAYQTPAELPATEHVEARSPASEYR